MSDSGKCCPESVKAPHGIRLRVFDFVLDVQCDSGQCIDTIARLLGRFVVENLPDERAGQVRVFRAFVEACAVDTTGNRWEQALGREQYTAWRDLLIGSGFARWRGKDRRSGWELTADVDVILQALEGADI